MLEKYIPIQGLEVGDITSIQQAAETFASFEPGAGSPPPPPPEAALDQETGAKLMDLLASLDESSVDDAQDSFDALLSILSENDNDQDENNPLKAALTKVGAALESGDMELAQENMAKALNGLETGSIIMDRA